MADYANYRPITVPNTAAKVLESLLSKKIIESIDTHDKINMINCLLTGKRTAARST